MCGQSAGQMGADKRQIDTECNHLEKQPEALLDRVVGADSLALDGNGPVAASLSDAARGDFYTCAHDLHRFTLFRIA